MSNQSPTRHFIHIALMVAAALFALLAGSVTVSFAFNWFRDGGGFDVTLLVSAVVVWLVALWLWSLVRKSGREMNG